MRIGAAEPNVDDREKARAFSTRDRGLRLRTDMPHGGIDDSFEDGCTNLLDLHQD